MEKRTIIGIDPGTNLLGFGVIEIDGGKPAFVDMGVLDLRKETDAYSKTGSPCSMAAIIAAPWALPSLRTTWTFLP